MGASRKFPPLCLSFYLGRQIDFHGPGRGRLPHRVDKPCMETLAVIIIDGPYKGICADVPDGKGV